MDAALVSSTFLTILLAELGDKTQLATMALGSSSGRPLMVFLGSTTALLLASLLGVMMGGSLASMAPPAWLHLAAGVGFLAQGVCLLLETRGDFPANTSS
ncbi:MAG: hypothetical protein TE42_00430 [Candidatus Synechococcus spongiarum SP3]|uniref:GDT1 family protein n=1 Tax=Candidatus Synechococcus spongiarum SP3 TaxID=1604020 RepID=A0A0G2HPA3_9SYNE|nr:MAG: hypothetical protein TE42_00430 [Candidatus Synechococcus spongiarum SP3]